MKPPKLLVFHQLNDFSGSPKVLLLLLSGLSKRNKNIHLFTTKGGCLDELDTEVKRSYFRYNFSNNVFVTLAKSFRSQIMMLFYGLRYGSKSSVFFINTIMPLGGAVAAKLIGARCIYHYHENAFAKNIYYRIKAFIMCLLADEIICVSKYQSNSLKRKEGVYIIPNALQDNVRSRLHTHTDGALDHKNIVLVTSLKKYKGVTTFFKIAERLSEYEFTLVLNATDEDIESYLKAEQIHKKNNVSIFSRQKDVTPFYNKASIALNLTDPKYAIETFGMTAIEAMAAGVPVIVPNIGGIADLVKDGVNGYIVDPTNIYDVCNAITKIINDEQKYRQMSYNALTFAQQFNESKFIKSFESLIYHE